MYSQLAAIDSLQLVCTKALGHRAPTSQILSPSFASGTESSNNFASALALSRGSKANNLGKGINRIWGRTHRCFHPTCDTRGRGRDILITVQGQCRWDNDMVCDLPTQPSSEGQKESLWLPCLQHSFHLTKFEKLY